MARHNPSMNAPEVLRRIVGDRNLHARLLNTLARMEYVGARKILKSRRAEDLDGDGLQHVLEEVAHSLRLKRAAEKVGDDPECVRTFDEAHTLAGRAGEDYVQGVDAAAAAVLGDVSEPRRTELNYLLSSVLIEVRAERFYREYDRVLADAETAVRVTTIYKDEVRHLAEMEERLDADLPDWRDRAAPATEREDELFVAWIAAVERVLDRAPSPAPV